MAGLPPIAAKRAGGIPFKGVDDEGEDDASGGEGGGDGGGSGGPALKLHLLDDAGEEGGDSPVSNRMKGISKQWRGACVEGQGVADKRQGGAGQVENWKIAQEASVPGVCVVKANLCSMYAACLCVCMCVCVCAGVRCTLLVVTLQVTQSTSRK